MNRFPCDKCSLSYATRGALKTHTNSSHGDPPECDFCHKSFSTTGSLRDHLKIKHKNQAIKSTNTVDGINLRGNWECRATLNSGTCDREFAFGDRASFVDHIKTHSSGDTYGDKLMSPTKK